MITIIDGKLGKGNTFLIKDEKLYQKSSKGVVNNTFHMPKVDFNPLCSIKVIEAGLG